MVNSFRFFAYVLFLMCSTQFCTAQKGTVAAGGEATGTTGTVSYSLGLVDFVPINGAPISMNQGIQQAYEIFSVLNVANIQSKFNLSLYPNPTTNFVVLTIDDLAVNTLSYKVYDIIGKQIALQKLSSATTNISLNHLAAATYFISVISTEGVIKTYKVIKH